MADNFVIKFYTPVTEASIGTLMRTVDQKLAAGATRDLAKQHSMKPVTTRRYHAGEHRVDIQINGKLVAGASFRLALA